jgi:hypothetical protein
MTACICGHTIEEHGDKPGYPGSMACKVCDCIAYEASEEDDDLPE